MWTVIDRESEERRNQMTEVASHFVFTLVPPNLSQIRIRCGWTYNRTVYFNDRYIFFEVTKCCDHCRHCLARLHDVDMALMRHGAQYEFTTVSETLTCWVTIELPYGGDPLDYLREVTGLPIQRVYFEIRRATRKKLDWIATGLLALTILAGVGWALWELGTRIFAYLFS